MTETNGTRYINTIAELYQIEDKDRSKLDGGYDKINTALTYYGWPDIERAINYYFVHKSDKTRPTIAQIISILKLWVAEGKIESYGPDPEQDTGPATFVRPTTNLWTIKDTFNKMIDILIDGGVFPDENGKLQNKRSIIDQATDLPVLQPMTWFGWKLETAKQERPDLFVKFPNATILEQLAIALQNKLIRFKVRDWAVLAEQARTQNGGTLPRGDINITFGTMGA